MGVAVTHDREDGAALAVGLDRRCQAELAGAALHLVGVTPVALVERRHRSTELDDIAVAVVPLVQQCKILDDLVYGHGLRHGLAARNGSAPHAPSIYSQAGRCQPAAGCARSQGARPAGRAQGALMSVRLLAAPS